MKLKAICPLCTKMLQLVSTETIGSEVLKTYKCGHSFVTAAPVKVVPVYDSVNGDKHAREYQKIGIDFINSTNGNCIVADQMRLGKTPQALLALASNFKAWTPTLLIVKQANELQWIREYKIWCDSLPNGIWPIRSSKGFIPPGFSAYIISMDTFSRIDTSKLLEFGFKQVVIDEAHGFKNPSSKRSVALISFLSQISEMDIAWEVHFHCICGYDWWEQGVIKSTRTGDSLSQSSHCLKCGAFNRQMINLEKEEQARKCNVMFLTGTPIKNNAAEFFVPLNILAPDQFPSMDRFKRDWLVLDEKSNKLRVKEHRLETFKAVLSKFMIRREKEDVYKDLPPLNRTFTVVEIEEEHLKKAYNQVLDDLEAKLDSLTYFNSIGELMLLRQICGLGKLSHAVEYAEELLENSDSSKLAIGLHHHAVRGGVKERLAKYGVVSLSGEDNGYQKDRIMREFETDSNRILAINMLAGGVGMDFHYVDNCCILERQWSSADEEQFEFRFYNPDKSIKDRSTNIEYLVAQGTIDEWFYNLVESKRAIFGETLSNNWSVSDDPSSFKALMEETISRRLK